MRRPPLAIAFAFPGLLITAIEMPDAVLGSATLAPRLVVISAESYSTLYSTWIYTNFDDAGKPASKVEFIDVLLNSGGTPVYSKSYYTTQDIITQQLAVKTQTYMVSSTMVDLLTAVPSSLPKGTHTLYYATSSIVYSVSSSTRMNGPLYEMTKYSTYVTDAGNGERKTVTLSKPVVVEISIPVSTSTGFYTEVVTRTVDDPPPLSTQAPVAPGPSILSTSIPSLNAFAGTSATQSSISVSEVSHGRSQKNIVLIAVISVVLGLVFVFAIAFFLYYRRRRRRRKTLRTQSPIFGSSLHLFSPWNGTRAPRKTATAATKLVSTDPPSIPYHNNPVGTGQRELHQAPATQPWLRWYGGLITQSHKVTKPLQIPAEWVETPYGSSRPATTQPSVLGKAEGNSHEDFAIYMKHSRHLDAQQQENEKREEIKRKGQQRRQNGGREIQRTSSHIQKQADQKYLASFFDPTENLDKELSPGNATNIGQTGREAAEVAPSPTDLLAGIAGLSTTHYQYEFRDDDDESDEEVKKRNRFLTRQALEGDTRYGESVYSQGVDAIDWRDDNK